MTQTTSDNRQDNTLDPVHIGLLSISDRASSGVYADQGLPALRDWLSRALRNPLRYTERLIPDDRATIAEALRELVDVAGCQLVEYLSGP